MECIFLFSMLDKLGGLALGYFIRYLFIFGSRNSVSQKKASSFTLASMLLILMDHAFCKDSIIDLFHWIPCHMYIPLAISSRSGRAT